MHVASMWIYINTQINILNFKLMKMKNYFLVSLLIFSNSAIQAVVRTVSNNPNSPGQYTSLPAAITAANANDTIYVVGSTTDYGTITINKQLTIIGSGYNPNKQIPYKTQISSITIARTLLSNPSNSKLIGIYTQNIFLNGYDGSNLLTGITITRCQVENYIQMLSWCSSYLAYNNLLYNVYWGSNISSSVSIYNNIIRNNVSSGSNFTGTFNVYNNLFVSSSASAISGLYFANVYNNVFYGSSPYWSTSSNLSLHNNISYANANNSFNLTGTNTGANNLTGVDPLFVNATPAALYTYSADFHGGTGSPVLTAGSGGTEIGIYGGIYPFPVGVGTGFQTSAGAPIPQIYEMNMQSPLVPVTGTLNVQLKARKVD